MFWKSEIRRPRRDREERERERERARDPVATLRKPEKIDPDPKNNNPDEIPACSVLNVRPIFFLEFAPKFVPKNAAVCKSIKA